VSITQITIIVIAAIVVVGVILGVWFSNRNRSKRLRGKFGSEYDLTLEKTGNRRAAEESLKEREERISKLDIHDLDQTERDCYQADWRQIQAQFVDDPSESLSKANILITEVMTARGFPVADFEQRAADLSVLFPDFVPKYREAHNISLKNQTGQASTEELRQAMVCYRSLFEQLLGTPQVMTKEKEMEKEIQ
jgi:hypothetical protein